MSLSQDEIELKLKNLLPFLKNEYKVSRIGYFGSYSTGLQNELLKIIKNEKENNS